MNPDRRVPDAGELVRDIANGRVGRFSGMSGHYFTIRDLDSNEYWLAHPTVIHVLDYSEAAKLRRAT